MFQGYTVFLPCRKAAAWLEGVSGDLTLVTTDCAKTLCFCKTNSHLGRDPGQTLHTWPEEAKPRPFHSACATAASRRLIPWLNLTGENKSQVFGQKESASPHMKNNQGGSGCLLPSIHTSVATARQPTALRPPVNATRRARTNCFQSKRVTKSNYCPTSKIVYKKEVTN